MSIRNANVAYDSKVFTKKGCVSLCDLDMNLIATKKYTHPKQRTEFIDFWKKIYPNKIFYIVIKPTL